MSNIYAAANADFEAVKLEIDKLSRAIGFVARALEADPSSLKISDSEPCPPIIAQHPGDYCFEHGNWPSADTIASLLKRYADAREKLKKLGSNRDS